MLQTVRSVVQRYGIVTGKTLHKASQKQIPVLILNPNDTPVELDQNTPLGILVPITEFQNEDSDNLDNSLGETSLRAETVNPDDELPEHLIDLYKMSYQHLEEHDKVKLKEFLIQYAGVFSKNDFDIGYCDIIEHEVSTKESEPIKQQPRRLAPTQRLAADKIVDDLLHQGLITPSKSPWASPIVMVKKKDNTFRMCIDYREVNKVSVKDAYPMPSPSVCFQQLSGANWFCSTDLASGYWQVKMSEKSKDKTAFYTEGPV